jgi:hypothetical protein
LYGYALGITWARRIEQRLVEDLGFRYLAGGARVDNWALSQFRRRQGRGINDVFTQVLEWARGMGWGRLGRVVIDSTRVKASACRDRVDTEQKLRNERAKLRRQVRRWQKACDGDDGEPGGWRVAMREAEGRLAEIPRRLERLRKSGMERLSRSDADARFLRQRGPGFELGYTAEIAVSDDQSHHGATGHAERHRQSCATALFPGRKLTVINMLSSPPRRELRKSLLLSVVAPTSRRLFGGRFRRLLTRARAPAPHGTLRGRAGDD